MSVENNRIDDQCTLKCMESSLISACPTFSGRSNCAGQERRVRKVACQIWARTGLIFEAAWMVYCLFFNFFLYPTCVKRTPKHFSCRSFSPVRLLKSNQPLFLIEILKSFVYMVHTYWQKFSINFCPQSKKYLSKILKWLYLLNRASQTQSNSRFGRISFQRQSREYF